MKIRTEAEYEAVLKVVEMLMDAEPFPKFFFLTLEGYALVLLSGWLREYEDKHFPIGKPKRNKRAGARRKK